MTKRIFVLALLAAIMALPTCKKAVHEVVTVQFAVGSAKIISGSGEKAASPGDIISYEDTIVTGPSTLIDLNFGTRGVIRISQNSRVKMSELQTADGGRQVQFDMNKGRLLAVMAKLSKVSGFRVKTPTTLAAVRGTSFMVVSDPQTSQISVLKGRVLVQLAKEGKLAESIEKMLEANKKVVITEDLVDRVIAGKKEIEVVALTQQEISDMKKEMRDIRINEKLDQEAKEELAEITAEVEKPRTIIEKKHEDQDDVQPIPSI